ncbi:hypothetical protein B0H14DRAFT_2654541 [Mycena olivaceomarginata]|nr:hypothetical protein B0H14DRAFT_2654541 [Mycena olivaceomarginata]
MSSGNAHLPYQHCYLEAFLAQILQYQRSRNTYASMEVVRFTREGRLLGPSAVPRTNVNVYETGVGLRHPRARGACGSTRRRDRTRGVAERGLARHRSSLPACRPTPAVEQGGGAGDGGGSAGSPWQAGGGAGGGGREGGIPAAGGAWWAARGGRRTRRRRSRAAVRMAERGRGGIPTAGGAWRAACAAAARAWHTRTCPPLLLATSYRHTPALEWGGGEGGRAREGRDSRRGRRRVPSPNSPLVVRVQNYGTVFGRERAGRARGTGGAAVLGGVRERRHAGLARGGGAAGVLRQFIPRCRESVHLGFDAVNGRAAVEASSDGYDGTEVPSISPQHKQSPSEPFYRYPENFAKSSWGIPGKLREVIITTYQALSFNFHVPKDTVDVGDEAQYLEKHGPWSLILGLGQLPLNNAQYFTVSMRYMNSLAPPFPPPVPNSITRRSKQLVLVTLYVVLGVSASRPLGLTLLDVSTPMSHEQRIYRAVAVAVARHRATACCILEARALGSRRVSREWLGRD